MYRYIYNILYCYDVKNQEKGNIFQVRKDNQKYLVYICVHNFKSRRLERQQVHVP